MIFWLNFRLAQSGRLLRRAGIGILLVAIVLAFPLWANGFNSLAQAGWPAFLGLSFLGIGLLHGFRTDRFFLLKSHHPLPYLFLVDYGLITAIFALIAALSAQFWGILASCSGLFWAFAPIGWLVRPERKTRIWLLDWVPVQAYETKLTLRQGWPMLVLAGLILLPTWVHPGFYIGSSVIIISSLQAGYDYFEPFPLRPADKRALYEHWRINANFWYRWWLPSSSYFLLAHLAWWPTVVYILASYEAYLLILTINKHQGWAPGRRRLYGGGLLMAASFSLFVPGGLIVLLGMCGWLWWRQKWVV